MASVKTMVCRFWKHRPAQAETWGWYPADSDYIDNAVQVLEVSAGTGRNVGWYPADVRSVLFTDVSYDMLRKAKLAWERQPRTYDATFVLGDVQSLTAVRACFFCIAHCARRRAVTAVRNLFY